MVNMSHTLKWKYRRKLMEDNELLSKARDICCKTMFCTECELYSVCSSNHNNPYAVQNFLNDLKKALK